MLYSPSIMAQLPKAQFSSQRGIESMFHWRGGYSDLQAFIKACLADSSPAGRDFAGRVDHSFTSSWSGIPESFPTWRDGGGIFKTAFDAFQRAEARLESTHFQPSDPIRTVFGPAWCIPEVIAGLPNPGRFRQRMKLPPKNLQLTISVSCNVDHADITRATATVARAAWNYLQAGGAVTITVHYAYGFHKPCDGAEGVVFSVQVPLTNSASFASAISAQQFRGAIISLATSLSGLKGDTLPVLRLKMPGALDVTGKLTDDEKARDALAIRG